MSLDPNFKRLSINLTAQLNMLWVLVYRATHGGLDMNEHEMLERVLSEVNRLHREMFPGFEHSLYGDDLRSFVERNDEDGNDE